MGGNKGTMSPVFLPPPGAGKERNNKGDSTLKVVLTSYKPPKRSHEETGGILSNLILESVLKRVKQ